MPRNKSKSFSLIERDILSLLCNGLNAFEIGERLGINHSTVRTHLQNMRNKTGAASNVQLVLLSINQFIGKSDE